MLTDHGFLYTFNCWQNWPRVHIFCVRCSVILSYSTASQSSWRLCHLGCSHCLAGIWRPPGLLRHFRCFQFCEFPWICFPIWLPRCVLIWLGNVKSDLSHSYSFGHSLKEMYLPGYITHSLCLRTVIWASLQRINCVNLKWIYFVVAFAWF